MDDKQEVFALYKKLGETPLECLEKFRKTRPRLKDIPMTYAGRLDPLAEGVLLVLTGEMCKEKEKYTALPKEYEFEILFGVSTDTGDILGPIDAEVDLRPTLLTKSIEAVLPSYIGKYIQTYPVYSSKTVSGKALWSLARERKLVGVELPKREVEIFGLQLQTLSTMMGEEILKEVERKIALVSGDFRQKEILKSWHGFIRGKESQIFQIAKLTVSSGSGLYVRTLSQEISKKLGVLGLAWAIKRTKVGTYHL